MTGPVSSPTVPLRPHHVGVAVADIDRALPHYRSILGLKLLHGPYDDPIQRVRVCFLGTGDPADAVIELIAPIPTEASESAPIHLYLKKELGAYHVCYETPDIERSVADMRAKGCLVVSAPVPAVAFDGRRIAWLYLPTRQLIELVERPVQD
ncbi:MAG: VOC family protein [Phycisphaerae bacterium]|nr:VOC family protein [Phycisphaerae bacterium]